MKNKKRFMPEIKWQHPGYPISVMVERECGKYIEFSDERSNDMKISQEMAIQNMQDIAHCMSDLRRFIEMKWPIIADLPSCEGVLLSGPENKHEVDALIAGLKRVAEFYESEIILPAKIDHEGASYKYARNDRPDMIHGFKDGYNACIDEMKIMNGIKE